MEGDARLLPGCVIGVTFMRSITLESKPGSLVAEDALPLQIFG
jgi:hypothetical protein